MPETKQLKTMRERVAELSTVRERANAKAAEICKKDHRGNHQRGQLRIKIRDVNPIDGGVEVFAQAFLGDEQLGFGDDGSVDIERFRIFNPPVLVPDGTKRDVVIDGKPAKEDNFVENPEEALLIALTDTIRLTAKRWGNIKRGRVGATVSTFYSSTGDANVRKSSTNFTTARSATSADAVQNAATGYMSGGKEGSTYNFYVPFFPFDTSAIGASDTISDAVFSVYLAGDNTNAGSQTAAICQSKQATWNSLVADDFNDRRDSIDGGTEGCTRVSLPATGGTTGYLDFTLNSTGRGWIARSGETKPASASASGKTQLAINFNSDLDNSPASALDGYQIYFADQTGTSNDPKLVVTHSSAVNITVTPAAQACTFSTPAATIRRGWSVAASVLSAVFSLPSRTVAIMETVTPSALSAVFSIPAFSAGGQKIVTPSVLTATFSIPSYVVSVVRNVTVAIAAALGLTLSTPSRTVSGGTGVTVQPSPVTATFTVPSFVVSAQRAITVAVSALVLTFVLPTLRRVGGVWTRRGRSTDASWTRTGRNSN